MVEIGVMVHGMQWNSPAAKQALLDDDSENEEEPEGESSSITMHDEALHAFSDLLTQHSEEQLSGTTFKVVIELQSIKLNTLMALLHLQ